MVTENATLLREHGLLVTAQRLAVLRALSTTPHATADVVAGLVTRAGGEVVNAD